jgi:hypothetical protein
MTAKYNLKILKISFYLLVFLVISNFFASCQFENYFSHSKEVFHFDESLQNDKNLQDKLEKILYINENNEIREITKNQFSEISLTQKDFSITLKQNDITPILVFFENEIYPVGTIYPYSKKISKTEGFSAKILFRFLNETKSTNPKLLKDYISRFNWAKFSEKIATYENPWILNQDLILQKLSDKTFSAKDIQVLKYE